MKNSLVLSLLGVALFCIGCSGGRAKSPGDWNKAERGAAVGGVGGAALGGIVGSQSGRTGGGALIGGAAGAGAGALIGNQLDKEED